LEWRQEDGAELEVFATGFANDANDVTELLIDGQLTVEFVIPLLNALGDVAQGVFEALADFLFEEVPLESTQALDLFQGFMVPAAQSGFGDRELSRDGVEGEASGAKFDELVFGFVIVHRSGRLEVENSQGRDERHEFHEWTGIRATGLAELDPTEAGRLEACDTAD
jgi:hypothetical protein